MTAHDPHRGVHVPAPVPAQMDVDHLAVVRTNVERLQRLATARWVTAHSVVLDIAPQAHPGVRSLLPAGAVLETLDIDPSASATYTADLCVRNDGVPSDRFDCVFCTEVLEHTLQPFNAVGELFRVLSPGGRLILSVPFNLRIHGPLPDCWRFTEHGLRSLLSDFTELEIHGIDTPDRPLMPIHYTVTAAKPVR
jgi:SAM-dependent methyltransferase